MITCFFLMFYYCKGFMHLHYQKVFRSGKWPTCYIVITKFLICEIYTLLNITMSTCTLRRYQPTFLAHGLCILFMHTYIQCKFRFHYQNPRSIFISYSKSPICCRVTANLYFLVYQSYTDIFSVLYHTLIISSLIFVYKI